MATTPPLSVTYLLAETNRKIKNIGVGIPALSQFKKQIDIIFILKGKKKGDELRMLSYL